MPALIEKPAAIPPPQVGTAPRVEHASRANGSSANASAVNSRGIVTFRAFLIGLLLSMGMAWLNNWLTSCFNVSTLGGIQMPFGAIFVLGVLVLGVNLPLRKLGARMPVLQRFAPCFSAVEMMTIYVMVLFAALVSTPGCDNQFMTLGPALFYFSTRDNNWANLFYKHVPTWFAPGWDGKTYQHQVIERLYTGGISFSQIPWHAWMAMLIAWSIFLLLVYSVLFFTSLIFRRQWIESEALAFPLVQLPLQMVDTAGTGSAGNGEGFWSNKTMWAGFGLAFAIHFTIGLNAHYPDFPIFPTNYYGSYWLVLTEKPWSAIGALNAKIFLGGIGIAYLLTREVSFSFWFFYFINQCQLIGSELMGMPPASLPHGGISSQPTFIIFQSIGAWVVTAGILVWTAREHLGYIVTTALRGERKGDKRNLNEPFSARFIVAGFILSFAGLLAWTSFAGINIFFALVFFGIFMLTSLVLTRLVIEGGMLFPQAPYYPLEWMTTGIFGANAIGPATLTKLSFLQPTILLDMRTSVLPGFMHTLKIADELRMDRKNVRRLLTCAVIAIVVSMVVSLVATLYSLYSIGGLAGYTWFSQGAPQATFNTAATMIGSKPGVERMNLFWMVIGGGVVLALTFARSRYLWFPLHPLGYVLAPAFPLSQLWFSFFVGWLVKSLMMKYGGGDGYAKLRPFMIGLILGNLSGMIFWMFVGFRTGHQIGYWPA